MHRLAVHKTDGVVAVADLGFESRGNSFSSSFFLPLLFFFFLLLFFFIYG